MSLPLKYMISTEVVNEIKQLKDGKFPKCDQIDNLLLKTFPRKGIVAIASIFNACLHLPGQCKIA